MPVLALPLTFNANVGVSIYSMTGSYGSLIQLQEIQDWMVRAGLDWSVSLGVANVRLTYRDGYSPKKDFTKLFPAMLSVDYVTSY
jgi:hypothetical protein